MKSFVLFTLATFFVVACAANPGTRPHDMSMGSHDAVAAQADQPARDHTAQSNSSAARTAASCAGDDGCWTSRVYPTNEHDAAAQRQRELATEHRAASLALREAEAQACGGISEDDRDMSPFFHREDIQSARPLNQQAMRATSAEHVGAVVVFRAVPGMTAQWLQRVVNCHLARAAAVGNRMPEMDYCPLVLKNVHARVTPVSDGFEVEITSEDPATVAEIEKRAEALVLVSVH